MIGKKHREAIVARRISAQIRSLTQRRRLFPAHASGARGDLGYVNSDLAPLPVVLRKDEGEAREQRAQGPVFGFDRQRRVAPYNSGALDDAALGIDRREADAFSVGEVR